MVWPVQTHPAQSTGPESKRNSGDGEYFSLDFSFYRTRYRKQVWRQLTVCRHCVDGILRALTGCAGYLGRLLCMKPSEQEDRVMG